MIKSFTSADRTKVMDLLRKRSATNGYADFIDFLDTIDEENVLSQRAADLDEYLTEQVKKGKISVSISIGIDELRRYKIRN